MDKQSLSTIGYHSRKKTKVVKSAQVLFGFLHCLVTSVLPNIILCAVLEQFANYWVNCSFKVDFEAAK